MLETIVLQLIMGLSMGAVLFVVTAGLSIIYGSMRIINFAHGAFYELSAFLAFSLVTLLGGSPNTFWVAILVVPVMTAVIGGVVERFLLCRIYGQPPLYFLLLTFGVAMVVVDVIKIIWHPVMRHISVPNALDATLPLMGQVLPAYHLFILVFSLLLAVALWLVLDRTKIGMLVRAIICDRDMAGALGINVSRIFTWMFMFGIWLAALGGVLMSPLIGIIPGIGMTILFNTFIVVTLGGMGSLRGSLVGALILGIVMSLGVLMIPMLLVTIPFLLMVVVLTIRPRGLFGGAEEF